MKLFEVDAKTQAQEKDRPKFTGHSFRNIYRDVKIPWGRYIVAALFGIAFFAISGTVASVASLIAAGDFSDPGTILKYVVISILSLGTAFAGYLLDRANYTLNTRVKSKLWRKILRLPTEFFDRESPNRVISRVTTDSDAALAPFTIVIIVVVLLASILGVVASGNGIFNTPMSIWLILGIIAMIVLTVIALLLLVVVGFITANRLSAFTSFLSERFADFKLIKASCAEESEIVQAHRLVQNRFKAELLGSIGIFLNYLSTYAALLFVYIGCFLFGWKYYSSGAVTEGSTFIRFSTYAAGISGLMMYVSLVVSALGTGAGQATKFAALFDEKEEDNVSGAPMPEQTEDIVLSDVSFSYDGERDVLQNISCRIPKGKVTALVGANGSGKSTLIKVIDRLYTDTRGEMLFGEQEVGDLNLAAWREKIGIVSQNASLFSGTLRDNICYGVKDVPEEKLQAVCRTAGLDDVLAAHPEGLDYEVGIGGCKLSGGEQQRVSIARAMIKDPELLILDEATANLDTRTAREVEDGINRLMEGRTVITIAHSYDMIKKADQIIVLSDGKILDIGTHDELMQRSEFYRELFRAGFEV